MVAALAAPILATHDPGVIDAVRRLDGPSQAHLLGTDNLGRDIFSRILYGSRWSLGTVAISTALIMTIGVAVGSAAGYFGGVTDNILMRVVDVLLAFPSILLALAIAGIIGPGITSVVVALVSVWWASYARVVRGMVLALREREFIAASEDAGDVSDLSQASVAGKDVWTATDPSGESGTSVFLYTKDDTVYFLTGTEEQVTEILAALP